MKKSNIIRLALISLTLLGCLLLAACDGNHSTNQGPVVDSIAIANNAKPQTVFAQGQELDLSKGSLAVVYDNGKKETVALNAEGVTVTGYDKDKLGDQSLIITYGGKSISLTVNVAKRMTFTGYEKDYFVGDALNLSKGKVNIVKNDGTTVSVRLNDPSISVVSFDSSAAGKGKLATIRYSADGTEYTDTIAVNVYDIGTIKFVKPTKSIYGSHNTELNLEGGYFTITAKDNEELTKPVTLTQDMVSGFDPSAVTKEHVDQAMVQTITVTYGGQSYTFDIRLFYSGVSIMQDAIDQLKDLDLTREDIVISEEDGLIAMEGVSAYINLTPTDRQVLVAGDVTRVARIFGLYAHEHANELGMVTAKAVAFINGNVELANNSTYADVEQAHTLLSDPDFELIRFHAFLKDYVALFKNVYVLDDITVEEHVKVIPQEMFDSVVEGLQFMMDLYNDLSCVPDEWVDTDLIDYYNNINAAVNRVMMYNNPPMVPYMSRIVSQWRTNNDLLEIVYAFYYLLFRGMMMDDIGYLLPFPGPVQELYDLITMAASISMGVEQAGLSALWYDNTSFYYYYTLIMEKVEEIENHENKLYLNLYNYLDFDSLIKNHVLYPNVGVLNMMGAAYGDEKVMKLLDDYIALVKKTMSGSEPVFTFEEEKEQFMSIMDQFISLSPRMQMYFLGAVYYLYGTEAVSDAMVLTFPEADERGIFMFMLKTYYTHYMSETTVTIAEDMLLAMEYYLNRELNEEALDKFYVKMDEINTAYSALSAEDKALFDQFMGKALTKYNLFYRLEKNGSTVDQNLYVNLFSELVQVYRQHEILLNKIFDTENNRLNSDALGAAIAAFSYAKMLNYQILDMNNEEIVALYSVLDLDWDGENKFNLDYLYSINRLFFLRALHDVKFVQIKEDGTEKIVYGWDVYSDADVDKLMSDAYHVMIQGYNGTNNFDVAKVLAAMQTLRQTMLADPRAIYIFKTLGGAEAYYPGVEAFFEQMLTEGNKAFADKLLEAEKSYSKHITDSKDAENKAAFMQMMEELITMRASVADTENFNTYLADMYNFYLEQYNSMKTAEER